MPLHNYVCTSGHVEKDVYFSSHNGGAKKTKRCPKCKCKSEIHFGSMGDFNRLMSTQGHNKVVADPQTGMFYENATDKKVKLKALGLEEGNKTTKEQIEAETYETKQKLEKQKDAVDTSGVLSANSLDEIMDKVEWDKVDRGASGDLNRNVEDGYGF